MNKNKWLLSILSAVLSFIGTAFFLRNGLIVTPDGWAYWEGSISLMNGDGYCYFGGQPITTFPPGFPVFLIPFQWLFGISGKTLVMVILSLSAVSSFIWSALLLRIFGTGNRLISGLMISVFVSVCHIQWFDALWSEALFLPLIGLLYWIVLKRKISWGRVCALVCVMFLAMITRNVGIAHVIPVALVVLYATRSIPKTIVSLFAPVVIWKSVRSLLEQEHFTRTDFSMSYNSGFFDRVKETVVGFSDVIASNSFYGFSIALGVILLSLVVFLLFYWFNRMSEDEKKLLALSILSYFSMFVIMIIFPTDPIGGRFIWVTFIPVIGCLASAAIRMTSFTLIDRIGVYVLITILSLQIVRTVCYVVRDISPNAPAPSVKINEYVSPKYIFGPDINEGSMTLIQPQSFSWIDRKYKTNKR